MASNTIRYTAAALTVGTLGLGGLAVSAGEAHAVRFDNDWSSTRSIYAQKTLHGRVYTVAPGKRAPKGTKYVRVLRNNKACYWGFDERGRTGVWKCYQGPVIKRQRVRRHFFVDFHQTVQANAAKTIAAAGHAPANPTATLALSTSNFKGVVPASNYGHRR